MVPPQKIRIIEHKAWQIPSFQIPKALSSTVIDILQERLKMGVIEPSHGPYQNPWYLVKKSTPGKYRLVNVAMELKEVTVRDTNLSPSANLFFEEFADCAISSLIDFFLGVRPSRAKQRISRSYGIYDPFRPHANDNFAPRLSKYHSYPVWNYLRAFDQYVALFGIFVYKRHQFILGR